MLHRVQGRIAITVVGMLLLATAACGVPTSKSMQAIQEPQKSQSDHEMKDASDELPTDAGNSDDYWLGLDGKWILEPNSTDMQLEAHITGVPSVIAINWITQDGEELYWKGSFDLPHEPASWQWTSHADKRQTMQGPYACKDEKKQFAYDHETRQLHFDMEVNGQTRSVTMVRP